MPRSPSPSPSPARNPSRRRHPHHRRRSPSPPPRRSLRPRRAAAASSRPLVDDFFPFPSSPSSSPSRSHHRKPSPEPDGSGGSDSDDAAAAASSASDRRRRKLKLVVKLSQLPPDHHHRRAPRPPAYSSESSSEDDGDDEQVKPPKKRRIEPRAAATEKSRHRESGGKSDAGSGTRSKRLVVSGMARMTPLPDWTALEMILDKLQKKDTYRVFAEPVDPDELPDYHDVIDHPMDFGTVRRKLAKNAYSSFEQFEDDVFLICSNAMQYNAPDTVYFRQAHSIQELARKKFQELRDDGISTENQLKNEQKVRPNSCHREPVKKHIPGYSGDDLGCFSHKEQVKKPTSRNSEDDLSSSFHKEQVKKHISRNSEDDLSSSFHKEKFKKSISRNSEDDLNSYFHKEQVKKPIFRNPGGDQSSSFRKEQVKKPISRNSKDDLGVSSQKKHVRKPTGRNREELDFSSHKEPVKKPMCINGGDIGLLSHKEPVEKAICRNREDGQGYLCQGESVKKPSCRDDQDDLGYSCTKEPVQSPVCRNGQDALGLDISAATVASAGDVSNGLSASQANAVEPSACTVVNGFIDKDISSPLDEIKSEKADELSAKDHPAKPSYKPIVVDETRRTTYNLSEEQPSLECDPIFDVFTVEPEQLVDVELHAEYSYARSLARFAASLGAHGWKIASERIKQALPAEVKFGRGWVGEYEPLSPSILVLGNQSKSQHTCEANSVRSASSAIPRDAERPRTTEKGNPKDMSFSLLSRITTGNSVGVSSPLESPEFKPRLFGVTAEPNRNSDARSLQESQKVTCSASKTKGTTSEQKRKSNSSSSTRPLEMVLQRPECSRGASSGMLDTPSLNKMNGQPKTFFQPPEAVVPQPRNEATWVYHGRPGDGKFGTSDKSKSTCSSGFITKNQPANATNSVMNGSGQKNITEHAKLVGSSTAMPSQADTPNKDLDAPRNLFSTFPAAFRENQSIPAAPAAQSWISFGMENKPAVVSPTFLENNCGWRTPFANVRASDDPKTRVAPQFFRQPVQVVSRESPVQNKGLVIFPQLVPTEFSRSQGQPQWQGLVPHVQQKPSKDMLRPDLNIGFPSPGSPPARQSSGINLEAQQPDLALQL